MIFSPAIKEITHRYNNLNNNKFKVKKGNIMKKISTIALIAASTIAISAPASAEQYYGFMDVNVNYLDWTGKTEDRTDPYKGNLGGAKEDFIYIELEGGAGFDWGDLYGFFDLENPENIGDDREGETDNFRVATKGSIAYNLGDSKWNAYGHVYHFEDSGYYDTNIVLGASYDFFTDSGFWMKPFLGAHIETSTYNGNGFNGYMAGWVFGYDFQVGEHKFSVNQWHETEFGRKDQHRGVGVNMDGEALVYNSVGQNGAISVWWHFDNHVTAGLQYRYADHKLGTAGYHDAIIYTLKYNL